jgi:hypothetical protein
VKGKEVADPHSAIVKCGFMCALFTKTMHWFLRYAQGYAIKTTLIPKHFHHHKKKPCPLEQPPFHADLLCLHRVAYFGWFLFMEPHRTHGV